jgi:hypothetical protein
MFNENGRAESNRKNLVLKYGGSWERRGNLWFWNEKMNKTIVFTDSKVQRQLYLFTNKDGVSYLTDNFVRFCRENELTKSAMGDILTGKRKQHKGFTVKRLAS